MTSHELAKQLLELPDKLVVVPVYSKEIDQLEEVKKTEHTYTDVIFVTGDSVPSFNKS